MLMTAIKSIHRFTKMLGNTLTKDLIELMHSNAKE